MRSLAGRASLAGVLAAVAVLVAAGADVLGGLDRLELVLYDGLLTRFRGRADKSPDIAILAVDDNTLQGIAAAHRERFGRWPYSRDFWAVLVRYLHQVGARALVFDMLMDEPNQDVSDDNNFADAVAETRLPTYIGFAVRPLTATEERAHAEGKPSRNVGRLTAVNQLSVGQEKVSQVLDTEFGVDEPAAPPDQAAQSLVFPVVSREIEPPLLFDEGTRKPSYPQAPIPQLIGVLPGFGLVLPEEDRDGAMRRTHFAYRDTNDNRYVTLAVAVAADLLGATQLELEPGRLRLGPRTLSIGDDGSAETDYGGPLVERFEVCSLNLVFNQAIKLNDEPGRPAVEPDGCRLAGRTLFVAGFAVGTYDVKATPFEPRAQGVAKQAAELDALLHGTFIRRVPRLWGLVWSLLVAFLTGSVVLAARSVWIQLAAVPLLVGGVLLGNGLMLAGGAHVPMAMPLIAGALVTAATMATNYLTADRERQRMQAMFSRYVSKLVVDQLAAQPELPKLDGENREITAFFSDIRKFSTFSEKFKDDPQRLVHLLNQYLTRLSGVLLHHGACLDKYIGDAVVCIFGAPVSQPDHAIRACKAALEVQEEVARLRAEYRAQGLPDMYTRVGVNSAVMFVGNFGSEQLFNYTAMGDGMNLASRLEGANKAYETLIMIGPRTYELARDFVEARELDLARVAGKTEAVCVYELLALKGHLSDPMQRVVPLYRDALAFYREARFAEALSRLEQALRVCAEDGPSRVLAARCRKLIEHPPRMPFDGIIDLDK